MMSYQLYDAEMFLAMTIKTARITWSYIHDNEMILS